MKKITMILVLLLAVFVAPLVSAQNNDPKEPQNFASKFKPVTFYLVQYNQKAIFSSKDKVVGVGISGEPYEVALLVQEKNISIEMRNQTRPGSEVHLGKFSFNVVGDTVDLRMKNPLMVFSPEIGFTQAGINYYTLMEFPDIEDDGIENDIHDPHHMKALEILLRMFTPIIEE